MLLKKQKVNLNNNTRLFFLLGLVNTLIIINYLLELWIPVKSVKYDFETELYDLYSTQDIPDMSVKNDVKVKVKVISREIVITSIKPTAFSKSGPGLDNIEIIADDVEINESIIESTEVGEKDAIEVQGILFSDIDEVEIEEEIFEDVPFIVIEDVPVFPGCRGGDDLLRKCLEYSIRDHVSKHFNVALAQELGLNPGRKRIFVMFVIDKYGDISNIKSRAPHKRLQKEAERVIKLLPTMKPGRQRGKPVGVKYSLPIIFAVH